ncbi:MAG: hypothetical protein L3J18_09600 [Candidatus Brocadia sp.]|nr:hypothetical protein [Candidatus Brocadia sp.]MDG5996090.1 hypothetical protein [Candidatus Brocadia sp.]UJS19179.1 MAG: hypothetical protein L3J18_09600 [Candidatus Brocadia sp.]
MSVIVIRRRMLPSFASHPLFIKLVGYRTQLSRVTGGFATRQGEHYYQQKRVRSGMMSHSRDIQRYLMKNMA